MRLDRKRDGSSRMQIDEPPHSCRFRYASEAERKVGRCGYALCCLHRAVNQGARSGRETCQQMEMAAAYWENTMRLKMPIGALRHRVVIVTVLKLCGRIPNQDVRECERAPRCGVHSQVSHCDLSVCVSWMPVREVDLGR